MKNYQIIKSFLIVLLAISYFFTASAQSTYHVSGLLTGENEETVPFAHVQLLTKPDSTFISGVVSDVEGKFILTHDRPGQYLLSAHYIGLEPIYISLDLDQDHTIQLGRIKLVSMVRQLSEITVASSRLKAVHNGETTSYYIDRDLRLASKNSVELLRNIPGVQVNLQQKIQIPGAQKVLIIVGGVERDASFLSQIDPARIEYIEFTRSPGAQYQSQVDAVITIVLSDTAATGATGHVNATIPTRSSEIYSFPSANLTYRKGKNTYFTSYEGRFSFFDIETSDVRKVHNSRSERIDFLRQENWSHKLHFGLKRDLKTNDQISIYGYISRFSNEQRGSTTLKSNEDSKITPSKSFFRNEDDDNRSLFFSALYNISLGKDTKVQMQSNYFRRNSNNLLQYNSAGESILSSHTLPVAETWQSRLDLRKGINQRLDVNIGLQANTKSFTDGQLIDFNYQENSLGTYISSSLDCDELNIKGGLRWELLKYGSGILSSRWMLLPTLAASYRMSENESITVTFHKNVRTPDIYQINPFILISDQNSVLRGNENLTPSTSHKWRGAYALTIGGSNIEGGIFHTKSTSVIDLLTTAANLEKFDQQYENLGSITEYGAEFITSLRIGKSLSFNSQTILALVSTTPIVNNNADLSGRNGWNFSTSCSSVLRLPYDFHLSASLQYNLRTVRIQYDRFEDPLSFLSITKSFENDLKVGISSAIPLTDRFTYQGMELNDGRLYQKINRDVVLNAFPVWINLSYSFSVGPKGSAGFRKHSSENKEISKGF